MREGTRTNLRPHIYNRNEKGGPWWRTAQWAWHPTVRGWYFGTLLKGWWQLGPSSINRHFEVEFAVGGEDNMAQLGIIAPFLLRWHIGVRVPRKLIKGWIYQRREWTLRIGYIGRWVELLFASDEQMRDTGMVFYYRRKREQGEELAWGRAALWPGWHLSVHPCLRDRIFGRTKCETTTGDPEPVVVPMPEGNYPAMIRSEHRTWKRPRWPWPSAVRDDFRIEMQVPIPMPGKGENSWDCDDDALWGTGGSTRAEAIGNAVKGALRSRHNYASPAWVPADGWPDLSPIPADRQGGHKQKGVA